MSDNNSNYIVELFIKTLNKKHQIVFDKENEEYLPRYSDISRCFLIPISMDKEMLMSSETTSQLESITLKS